MNKKLSLAAFAVSVGFACTPAAAAYTSIFAFGDSLSDAGNLFSETGGALPLAPYVDATSATARPGRKTCRKCWALVQ